MYPNYNMYNQYYGFREYNYRNSEMKEESGEIITLNQAIDLIRKSVDDEKEDEMFYGILIEQAPTDKEKDIIRSIRDDERKHNQILRELYYDFTGQILPADNLTNSSNNQMSYKENLENKKKEEIKKEKKQVANIEEHWGEIASSRECQLTDEDLQILKDFIKDL